MTEVKPRILVAAFYLVRHTLDNDCRVWGRTPHAQTTMALEMETKQSDYTALKISFHKRILNAHLHQVLKC